MAKILFFIIPAILLISCKVCEGLECYHCYTGAGPTNKDSNFVQCNEKNLTASNTNKCPENSQCIYETVEVSFTKQRQVWRTCSNPTYPPCDPKAPLPPGFNMVKCSYCGTDLCNLKDKQEEEKTFTFNINADVNLFIRQ